MEEVTKEKKSCKERVKGYFKTLPKRYFITAFSGMAQGLFVTLIAGTILAQIAGWINAISGEKGNYVGNALLDIATLAKILMGAGIGVGIAHALGKNKLVVFSAAVAGMVGAFAGQLMPTANGYADILVVFEKKLPGNPIGAYIATMLCVEIVDLYAGKTKLDILFIPLGTLCLAFVGVFVSYPFIELVNLLGKGIGVATKAVPLIMGIVIAVAMGILLTMPTSSAAIWAAIAAGATSNQEAMFLAGGAATVGCACHMVGFAVASFRENKVSGLISQGLGTSMLQIPNIMKKPIIMLPMIISSAICGPLSTCLFELKCGASGGGMGTSGLVGVFGLFEYANGAFYIVGIFLLMFVLPILLNLGISEFMRKKGWIKEGDMKLPD